MLVKKCGLEGVKEVMPEEHMKLLTNIRKTKERKERKYAANTEKTKSRLSKATTSRMSRWNHTKIFSEFGDEETENGNSDDMDTKTFTGRHSLPNSKKSLHRSKRAGKSLPEDTYDQMDDEPLDLLDRQKTRLSLRSSDNLKRKIQSDDEPELDANGRLIIREDGTTLKRSMPTEADDARSQVGSTRSVNSRKAEKRRKTTGDWLGGPTRVLNTLARRQAEI